MPVLHWIGKEKIINHHQKVPYRILNNKYTYNAEKSENKIIQGDNLQSLKSLLPEYEKKIRCIYIDPPYNTGNEKWVYNDNVNNPKIKKWLGEVVGKEGEDLSRHDKWLCMMYPRLKLLQKLLADNGVIFVSIDENEIHHLRMLMDEIFGENNFVEQIVWNKRVPKNDKYIGNIHEYILVYVKNNSFQHKFIQNKDGIPEINQLLEKLKKKNISIKEAEIEVKKLFKKNNYDRGITLYNSLDSDFRLWGKINVSWPNGQTFGPRYDVLHPITKKPCKVPDRGWRWKKSTFDNLLDYNNIEKLHDGSYKCGSIWFAKDENTQPSSIKYLDEVSDMLLRSIISTKSEGAVSLTELINEKFDYPKPLNLIELLLNSIDDKDGIYLDSFAGSGTTAHAILNLNKRDKGNRKFILIEIEEYANTLTAERIKNAINGYSGIEGTGGDFSYNELGDALFKEGGNINDSIDVNKIREYIYFMETKRLINKEQTHQYLLGIHNDVSYYFYYDKHELTVLDFDFLSTINKKTTAYIIYADTCVLNDSELINYNITFKKIPRDILRL